MQSVQICNNTQIKVKTSLSLDEPKCTWIIIGHWNATQKLVFGDKVELSSADLKFQFEFTYREDLKIQRLQ